MRTAVRTSVAALCFLAGLRHAAVAGPQEDQAASYDRDAATRASPEQDTPRSSPWLDLSPSNVLAAGPDPARRPDRRLASALTLGGLYAGFVTWTYFAWYRTENHEFLWADPKKDGSWKVWSDDGWFGPTRYAGGADKLGHAWATLALGRAGTELLHQWGGYGKLSSALVGNGLSWALFLGVEIKDGYAYTFSIGDFVFNTIGAGLGIAQSLVPAVDDLIDFRVAYVPSPVYREHFKNDGDVDVAEDYSGQTYLLAFHLGAIKPLREARWGTWSQFVDVAIGFESRGYKPEPPAGMMDEPRTRSSFVGISLNAQGLFDYLLRGRSEPLRKITHGAFEVFNLPYTHVQVLDRTVHATEVVPEF